jgi:hypothetical protein
MPYDEDGNYYPTYGGASSPGGSSWDTGAYDPNASFDPYGPKVDVPTGPADAMDRREQQLAAAQAALNARGANGGAAARTPSSSMSTSQAAYSAATGGAYDPSTAMTAYQQAQLGLSQQQLYQDQQQFMATLNNQANIAAGNLGFNYAQLGQQGGQFQQNYGLDLAQFAMQSQGTPYQWAQLGLNANQIDTQQYLDQQRIDLSRQLGMGDDARGWAQMALAEEDHDLRMYLGQNDVLKSQAQIQAEMARLGIDLYQANLSAEIQRAKLALDQQVASGQAAALSQQAAADAARAQAALRAVEVELQLGEGNLELGWQKTRDAMDLGLEDINLRREELGLKDKISTQDLALQTLLGVEGINVSREKLANDRLLGISDQQTRRDIAQLNAQVEQQRIASTLTGPRDWAKAVENRRLMAAGGQNPFAALAPGAGQLAGEVGGPSEPLTLDSFLADNGFQNLQGFNFQNGPWQQMTGGGFQSPAGNPWSGQNIPAQPGAPMDWNTIYQQITGQSGGSTAAGAFAPPPGFGQPQLPAGGTAPPLPGTPATAQAAPPGWAPTAGYDPINNFNSPRFGERAPWADALLSGQISPWQAWQSMPKATPDQWNRMSDAQKNGAPWMNPFYTRQQVEQQGIAGFGGMGLPMAEAQQVGAFQAAMASGSSPEEAMAQAGMSAQMFGKMNQAYGQAVAEGREDLTPVQAQSLSDYLAQNPWVAQASPALAQRAQAEQWQQAQAATTFGGRPQQEMYQDAGGNWYAVPQGYGQQTAPTPAAGAQAATTPGSFQAPTTMTTGGYPGLPGMPAMTGNFMGIPIPQAPQIPQIPYPNQDRPSIVAQMYQQYLQSFPTGQAQQSPPAQNAMAYIMQMMQQAQAQAQAPPVTTPPAPTGTTPPPTGTTPPPTGQQPYTPYTPYGGGIQPGNTTGNPNWMPGYTPNSPYYSGGYGMPAVGSWQPDSPGVYSTGANADVAGAHVRPGEAGGAPATQYIQTKVRSSVDAAKAALAGAPTSANATTGIQRNTGPGTGYQDMTAALRGGPLPPTVPQYTVPSPGPATYYDFSNQQFREPAPGQHAGFDSGDPNRGYGAWPQDTGLPEYATGTSYVSQTGPAIVHQGEAIVPAAQNPANPDAARLASLQKFLSQNVGGTTDTTAIRAEIARLQAAQPAAGFTAPTGTQQPQVQQAPKPAAPANLNTLTNPQQPLTPQQQQQAPNQQAQAPMAPQPVPREPQHAQPTSPPNATIYTAGLTPTPPPTGFTAPTSTPPATTNPAMTALMARLPSPQQVSYRVWSQDLSPSEREMAIGEWTRQGHYVPDILALIEQNRLTRQQGAYAGQGYAQIGR